MFGRLNSLSQHGMRHEHIQGLFTCVGMLMTGIYNLSSTSVITGYSLLDILLNKYVLDCYCLVDFTTKEENFIMFHPYLRYFHKCGIIVFSIKFSIHEPILNLLAWLLPKLTYLSMLYILELQSHFTNE